MLPWLSIKISKLNRRGDYNETVLHCSGWKDEKLNRRGEASKKLLRELRRYISRGLVMEIKHKDTFKGYSTLTHKVQVFSLCYPMKLLHLGLSEPISHGRIRKYLHFKIWNMIAQCLHMLPSGRKYLFLQHYEIDIGNITVPKIIQAVVQSYQLMVVTLTCFGVSLKGQFQK